MTTKMKTLVLGLGNPIVTDDAVGLRVVQKVSEELDDPDVSVVEQYEGGLRLLDAVLGYDRVIIVDAIQTRNGKPGQVYRLKPEDFSFAKHLSSPHSTNLVTALELGRMLNLAVPQEITIFAVEAADLTNFSERCTPEVEKAIPEATNLVLQELSSEGSRGQGETRGAGRPTQ